MGYYRLLQEILHPLRVYDVETGPSAAELFAEGQALDKVLELLETQEREALPCTAENVGLERYEQIMPFVPVFAGTQQRREAIMALLRIDWCSFTLEALRSTLAGCGVAVELRESQEPETVEVVISGVRGIPDNFEDIAWRVEQILPCHLGIMYIFRYLIWQELELWMANWDQLEAKAECWDALEKYSE